MRRLKTPQELIQEGYNAEAAVAFLHDFINEEKEKQLQALITCHEDELPIKRAVYKYIESLEPMLIYKVQTGINNATEQFQKETR